MELLDLGFSRENLNAAESKPKCCWNLDFWVFRFWGNGGGGSLPYQFAPLLGAVGLPGTLGAGKWRYVQWCSRLRHSGQSHRPP